MFAVTGITGNVGGHVARHLLSAGQPVRAVVRDIQKAAEWAARGCDVRQADINDAAALAAAFEGTAGVFVLVPPNFDPLPGFPEAHAIAATLKSALEKARPGRVVYLSTIGAQAQQVNLLTQHTIIERALAGLPMPIAFLRPGWFMENCKWDIASARDRGVISSFLQPAGHPVAMIAGDDVGRVAAELLRDTGTGRRLVELEGPRRVSPNDIAAALSQLLDRNVSVEGVPRDTWEQLFVSQEMKNPQPRIRMLDGFNEGWIEFEHPDAAQKGRVELIAALRELL